MTVSKTEVKAYLAALKGVAKSKSPFTGSVFVKDNEIKAATSDMLATLKAGIKGDGEYRVLALDLYAVDYEADIKDLKTGDYEYGIEKQVNWAEPVLINGDLERKLLHAYKFVSTDTARPALQQVVIKDGWVMATDGYKAYVEGREADNVMFSPALMGIFKKLEKYGTWSYKVGSNERGEKFAALYNEYFSVVEKQCDCSFPDLLKIMELKDTYDMTVELPVSDLCKLTKDGAITVMKNGDIMLEEEAIIAPVKATVEKVEPFSAPTFSVRELVMPRYNKDNLALSLWVFKNLAEDGKIKLAYNSNGLSPLIVLR